MEKWVDVFQGGPQRCSKGKLHDGTAKIERALGTFNPAAYQPGLIIGHRAGQGKVYARVTALRKVEEKGRPMLQAKFESADPAFTDLVASGQLPNRSAAFRKDGSLDHVALLGATPPAVADLGPFEFSASADLTVFEWRPNDDEDVFWRFRRIGSVLSRVRDYLVETLGLEKADQVLSDYEVEIIKAPRPASEEIADFGLRIADLKTNPTKEEVMETFTKEHLDAQVAAAVAAEKARADKAEAEFAASKLETARRGTEAWLDGLIRDGKALPAWKEKGLVQFMAALEAGSNDLVEFEHGQAKQTPAQWFKGFIESFGAHPLFKEMAAPQDDKAGGAAFEGADLSGLTKCV